MTPLYLIPIVVFSFLIIENFPVRNTFSVKMFFLLILFLSVFTVFRNPDLADYANYKAFYYEGFDSHRFEPTAKLIRVISPSLFLFFFFYAFISIGFKTYAIGKNSSNPIFSLITYLSTSFALHDMIQIRVSCAIGIFWISLHFLQNRQYIKYVLVNVLGCFFHISAIIFLILPFLSSKKFHSRFWIFFIPFSYVLAIIHFDFFDILAIFLPKESYVFVTIFSHKDANINIYNINQLLRIIIFIFFCVNKKRISNENLIILKIFGLSIVALPLLSSMPVVGYRISEMLGTVIVFLLPQLIICSKNKSNGYLFFIICCFMFCYLNNVHNKYGLI